MINFRAPLNLIFLAIGLLATLAGFLLVPVEIALPVHWGVTGQVDAALPRNWALLQMPAVTAAVWAIFWAIGRFGDPERREASTAMLNVSLTAVTGLMVLIQIMIVLIGLGVAVDVLRVVVAAMALLQIALGNVMPKSRPNAVAGIRLPWTMADPANWQATHRLTGALMIVSGLLLLGAAVLLPAGATLLAAILATWLAPMLIGGLYSYLLSRRRMA